MQWSYSRVSTYEQCPYKYKLRYIDRLKVLPELIPTNPLILGKALHTALELGVDAGAQEYLKSYPIAETEHFTELMKLDIVIPAARELLPVGGEYEIKVSNEHFVSYIDYLFPVGGEVYDIYDFKYSNNAALYMESWQLHLYKYFFERINPGKTVRNLYYLMVPKTKAKQKKNESVMQYRVRILEELSRLKPALIEIAYNPLKVRDFSKTILEVLEAETFPKKHNSLCYFCDFARYCGSEGKINYNILEVKK